MSDKRSQFLALLLRHKNSLGIVLDSKGWTPIGELISKTDFTRAELEKIVAEDEKQRYAISPSGNLMRANQGHSLPHIRLEMPTGIPPVDIFHGTKEAVYEKIMKEGLLPMNRHHVHLSCEPDKALAIANRRKGGSLVLRIDSSAMVKDGLKFYKADNGIWLVDKVEPKYLSKEPI